MVHVKQSLPQAIVVLGVVGGDRKVSFDFWQSLRLGDGVGPNKPAKGNFSGSLLSLETLFLASQEQF